MLFHKIDMKLIAMDIKGLPEMDILKMIEKYTSQDIPYTSGQVLGSMVALPHKFAIKVYMKYIDRNLGDLGSM